MFICLLLLFLVFQLDCSLGFSNPSSSLNNSSALCLPKEKFLLLQFKNTISVRADNYCNIYSASSKINLWNKTTNCCVWEGVTCDKVTSHVIGLDLSCSGLVGTLFANTSLFLLPQLQKLNLAGNNFEGSIPSMLFTKLVSLTHLNFSKCNLVGLVPSEISLLSKLVSLDLSGNIVTFDNNSFGLLANNSTKLRSLVLDLVDMSHVPTLYLLNLTSSLKHLSLYACNLDGKFPNELFRFPYLNYLDLSSNLYLSGDLIQSNWNSPFQVLDLSDCDFRGPIPTSLGNLTKISYLSLSKNNFEGQFPDVFENLNHLNFVETFDCNFSSQLPSTIFNLTLLKHLDFSGNEMEGFLPIHVGGLQNLELLDLSNNRISGALPSWVFSLASLHSLNLAHNNLVGQILEIPSPNSIQYLNLANNHIYGSIPSSFFDLANLTRLDMSSNNLSDVVKSNMLAKFKNLKSLDLSNNNLLSLSSNGSDDQNYTFHELEVISFSLCNVIQFPNFLRNARSLTDLDLSNNKISGSIFEWESQGWEHLSSLNLSYNFLTSLEKIPGDNLAILDLRSNLLQSHLLAPPPYLQEFYISNNKLTGEISLICNLSSLIVLDFSRNNLAGIIPPCLVNSSTHLKILNLQMNNFHGQIPAFESNFLQNLALNENQLEGLIPRSLVSCTSLVLLNLANNSLNDTFPHWLGILPELRYLILRSNGFHGRLDHFVMNSSFTKLQIVDLSHNQFTGLLPTQFFQSMAAASPGYGDCISEGRTESCHFTPIHDHLKVTMKRLQLELDQGTMLPSFRMIDLSNNRFYGSIPKVIGQFTSLHVLNFSCNNLIGPIPPSLGNVEALESLDLSSNNLSGIIPLQLTELTFLEVLNLSQNDLAGTIPLGNQFGTFGNDSYMGNPRLCGSPLSKKCGSTLEPLPSNSTHEDDAGLSFIWEVVMMGYGCGVVLGLSTAYIVFTTRKPCWFVRKVERDWQRNVTNWIRINGRRRN